MPSLLRTALVWIVALALPMQVLAAATMLHCGPASANPATAHDHQRHDPAAERADAAAHRHATVSADAADESAHQCSACAACCVGAALPGAVLPSVAVDPARPLLRALQLLDASVVLAGIERPPRDIRT